MIGKAFSLIVTTIMVLWMVGKCSSDAPNTSSPRSAKTGHAKIADFALPNYTPNSYPETFATWGEAGVLRIEQLALKAADAVSLRDECDSIELVELSNSKSAAPNYPVVFVDCANGHRFYISETDVVSNAP